MIKTSLSFLIVLCILSLFIYFANSPESIIPVEQTFSEKTKVLPNAIAISPVTKSFTESGKLESVVKARKLEHYKSDKENPEQYDYSVITLPELGFFEKPQPWLLNANQGVIDSLTNEIRLSGQVIITQETPEQGETNLKTDELLVFMSDKKARTEKKVQIFSPFGILEARGMNVDFKDQKIELLSRVKGKHDPS